MSSYAQLPIDPRLLETSATEQALLRLREASDDRELPRPWETGKNHLEHPHQPPQTSENPEPTRRSPAYAEVAITPDLAVDFIARSPLGRELVRPARRAEPGAVERIKPALRSTLQETSWRGCRYHVVAVGRAEALEDGTWDHAPVGVAVAFSAEPSELRQTWNCARLGGWDVDYCHLEAFARYHGDNGEAHDHYRDTYEPCWMMKYLVFPQDDPYLDQITVYKHLLGLLIRNASSYTAERDRIPIVGLFRTDQRVPLLASMGFVPGPQALPGRLRPHLRFWQRPTSPPEPTARQLARAAREEGERERERERGRLFSLRPSTDHARAPHEEPKKEESVSPSPSVES